MVLDNEDQRERVKEVYFGNMGPHITEWDLRNKLRQYRSLRSIWLSKYPWGFAFVKFDDLRDALGAARELNDRNGWIVSLTLGFSKCLNCGINGHEPGECPEVRGRRWHRSPINDRRRSNYRDDRRSPVRRYPIQHGRNTTQKRRASSRASRSPSDHRRARRDGD
ncbi:serine/arginine-rich splicing factor RSZ21-like isoform X2 [Prosopis cineraria]|uniref:serine/arginine-rich splicing factor RSZ21-like isoform X2 n=1 Tax=Prosopis cineraria TaxID=364024 RepID=UPI00240FB07A|nr:serine/arginine-rich splicing factor RSZ21-like isoform X2 [Prosopis cineraria]